MLLKFVTCWNASCSVFLYSYGIVPLGRVASLLWILRRLAQWRIITSIFLFVVVPSFIRFRLVGLFDLQNSAYFSS